METKKPEKFCFFLHNIDIDKVDKMYNITISSNLETKHSENQENLNITKLLINEPINFCYLDDAKKDHKCTITMKDYITKKNLKSENNICCYWCRSEFITTPIGCPIEYIPSRLTSEYYSEITKDNYIIHENITKQKRKEFAQKSPEKNIKITVNKNENYLTDGLFCSFNCCLSFIQDNKHKPLYNKSENLLFKIYYDIFEVGKIIPAPHWRLLNKYGGDLSIEKFRNEFNKNEYVEDTNYISFRSIGFLFEQKIKF